MVYTPVHILETGVYTCKLMSIDWMACNQAEHASKIGWQDLAAKNTTQMGGGPPHGVDGLVQVIW